MTSQPPQISPWDLSDDLGRFLSGHGVTPFDPEKIAAIARYEDHPPGTVILQEGEINARLYFLIDGSVNIVQGGETIARLARPGTLLGEMSLITKNRTSAASVAAERVHLLALDVDRIAELPLESQVTLSHLLNRLYSVILAEKLTVTNEKARLFEQTNRELQAAKLALEVASRDKINDLSRHHRSFFQKLLHVYENEIVPATERLKQPASANPAVNQEILMRLERVRAEFAPLAQSLDAEAVLARSHVLLIEDAVDEQINARMSLGGTGVQLTVVSDSAAAQTFLDASAADIVCLNENFTDLIALIRRMHPKTKIVFATAKPIAEHLATLKAHPELSAILTRHPEDRSFTVKNTATTIRKLLTDDIFGLEKYLSWGTTVSEFPVMRSDQRPELLEKLEAFLDSIGIRGPLKRKSARAAEELLMNAIYDAPIGEDGQPLYNHRDRAIPLELQPSEYATFRFASDGNFIAVSVTDRFGKLTRPLILDYLERCFRGDLADSPAEKGGGGNGLFQIVQSASLTAFNVHPGTRTEVISLLNINIQLEKISTHPSFHFFEYQATKR